ncbi:MAG: hypothetical protein ACI4MB_04590 [Candidatus Coproplasma sp.]
MKKVFAIMCVTCTMLFSFGMTACNSEKKYFLSVNGVELLYEDLNDSYSAGEEVTVKVKIKPYEGVKATLGIEQLVKSKSTQDDYWQFNFEMPSHDATLDIKSFKGFDERKLYGFYLTFNDKNGEPIEEFNKPIDSEEAIADYAVINYEYNHQVYTSNTGANVFADCKKFISNVSYELEDTLYYTYELIDAVACVDWVYYEENTQQIYSDGDAGLKLNDNGASMSLVNNQNLSDNRYTSQMKEYEEKFDSSVKINFVYLDYLTGVKVLEYNANNELIQSTDIAKTNSELSHIVNSNCEYVVIEEQYTVKSGECNGETYVERTLINKNNGEFNDGKVLKFPRGNGLISPVYLSVK